MGGAPYGFFTPGARLFPWRFHPSQQVEELQVTTTKQSTFGATLRTTLLLATLSGLLVAIGFAIGGASTALVVLFMAAVMNLGSWFFSDKLALKMSGAKPISEGEARRRYQMVREAGTRG